ncbi:MAG: hypothetical protein IH851_10375 [Armatimonadetes bacterium]|nr:hypothetical protein [Armatimonadota bacterium]
MGHKDFKKFFGDNYVVVHLTVSESPDKKHLENAGGQQVMKDLGGERAGLPYFAVLNREGKVLIGSKRPVEGREDGRNVGHPVQPEEIAHFMRMMRKTAKYATEAQLKALEDHLKNQKIG